MKQTITRTYQAYRFFPWEATALIGPRTPLLRFPDHTVLETHISGRIPLIQGSAHRGDLCLTSQHSQDTYIQALSGIRGSNSQSQRQNFITLYYYNLYHDYGGRIAISYNSQKFFHQNRKPNNIICILNSRLLVTICVFPFPVNPLLRPCGHRDRHYFKLLEEFHKLMICAMIRPRCK